MKWRTFQDTRRCHEMEDLEAAENDEEMEAVMYAAVDKYLGIEDNPFLEAAN